MRAKAKTSARAKAYNPKGREKATERRSQAAGRTASTARGFDAGKHGRRLKAIPSTVQAINTQIRAYGRTVVARSRYLATNNAYASAAKEAFVSAFVGTGIKPSSLVTDKELKNKIAKLWRQWTDESDADGLTDFYGQQSIIGAEMFEAGECFIRLRPRLPEDGLAVPFQLQLLPSELLPLDHNVALGGGRRIECGIEFDAIGRRVAYHFYRRHPGSDGMTWDAMNASLQVRVPAEEVLHLFKPIRAGQIRGVPHTLSGMITLAMLDLYDDAELERKRIAALFGAFVTREKGEAEEENPFGVEPGLRVAPGERSDFSLEPGAVIDLEAGQNVVFAEPADVGANFEPFEYRALLRASAGFGVTYSDMTGDLRQTSYGSIRAGMITFRRKVESLQHAVMIFQFCRPIWKRWFDDAVLNRKLPISATAYLADPLAWRDVKWIPPHWDWIDPLKDRQAEKLAVDSGFKARSDVIEAEGYDPEEVDARILADQERADELGLAFIQLATSVIVSPNETETLVETPEPDDSLAGFEGVDPESPLNKPKPKSKTPPKRKPKDAP